MLNKYIKAAQIMTTVAVSVCVISCASTYKQESTGQYLDGSVITAEVKAKLLADESVKSLPITVKTYKNTVQLSGFVNSSYQKQHAVAVAKSVQGVHNVDDSLVIKTK